MTLYADIKRARADVEMARRRLVAILTVAVIDRDKSTSCHYCGEPTIISSTGNPRRRTLDHVIPVSFGGKDELDNLVLSCQACNSRKGDQVHASQLCPACRGKEVAV